MGDIISTDHDNEMQSMQRRIAALEGEVRALRAKAVQLESGPGRKMVPAPPEPVTRVTQPPPVSSFKMPSAEELGRLRDAVGRHFPTLLDSQGPAFEGTAHARRQQWNEQFAASFLVVGNLKRTEKPNSKVYLSYWTDVAEQLLRSLGRPSMTIRANAFLAAALAHADVAVSGVNRQHEGLVPEIGLHQYTGRPAGDAWRQILAGQPPREVGTSRPPAPASPARVYAGN